MRAELGFHLVLDRAGRTASGSVRSIVAARPTSIDHRIGVQFRHAGLPPASEEILDDCPIRTKLRPHRVIPVHAVLLGLWFPELDQSAMLPPFGRRPALCRVKRSGCLIADDGCQHARVHAQGVGRLNDALADVSHQNIPPNQLLPPACPPPGADAFICLW